ncbi:MAG: single-stranded-DNA-specific exonuclease RecJ [Rhodospirillaceae bacterium]|nr:single-stranded-DNA-specific exonuclease RecJ [Rhodospirillaceae bacterium]
MCPSSLKGAEAPPNPASRDDSARAPAARVLGVERSLTGRTWLERPVDPRAVQVLCQRWELSELTARVLAGRGVDLDDVPGFLAPTLRDLLPDPDRFLDMLPGAERLAGAIMQNECIGIFGDYDVDGATSSALLARFIAAAGGRSAVHIPDRIKEGYGPNRDAMLGLRERHGASVVVTVDCGTLAFEPLAAARDAGIDVVVVDHHTAEAELPQAQAVINPNRLDETAGHGQMAAVGVTFLVVVAVNRVLRGAGWYKSRPAPDLMQWLDLVALGTVCDVVPLTGINRALVTQGLKVMAGRRNLGLRALADVAGVDETPTAYHLGFVMGPRVNAGGRVGESDLGYRLMTTEHEDEAWHLARKLDGFNRERQAIEADVLAGSIGQLEDLGGGSPNAMGAVALAHGEGWHPGVIGIVASRLRERYNRPACVVAFGGAAGDGAGDFGVGSGRSVKGVDLGSAIIAARQAGLIVKGGGHAMAAGFTVAREKLLDFQAFLDERVAAHMAESGIQPTLYLDGGLRPDAATEELVEEIAKLGPFGSGNPEPRFVMPHAQLTFADRVGENHVKCAVAKDGKGSLGGIAFRALDSDLGAALLNHGGRPLHLAGRLRLNKWNGRTTVQFQIEDAQPSD